MTAKKTENLNIASTVFLDLRRQILSGELAAGERLPGERELAARYGTNRNTLREAVRRLEQTRLVTVRHGQGVTVADFHRTGTMELLAPLLEASNDYAELALIVQDILPARLIVLEFAARLASQRADRTDIERLRDITDLLVSATEGSDPNVLAKGFQRWLEALVDAGHSVAMRWVANPFLDSYRELLDRFPTVWVLDPHFPDHLKKFIVALEAGDEEKAVQALRGYYTKIDSAVRASFSTIASHPVPGEARRARRKE
ncbi:MAG TPA: GntR family transcriptional regulator [Polyangiaceae bacterium]|nr:GntR family transcriptional regulator [Polyangiaceae bacterium]